tara:strand:- start:4432 stop:4560 length:129 start_codon:yes stop_codon:yes gene_type:complete
MMGEHDFALLKTLSILIVPCLVIGLLIVINDLTGFSEKYGKK